MNIYQRMQAVMKEVTYVRKQKGGMQYSSVSHDDVTAKLRGACVEHGIIVTQTVLEHRLEGNNTVCDVLVTLVNADKPEDKVELKSFGYGIDKQDKGPGKAMSYAFKYALLKGFMLETGDDPDRDAKTPDRETTKKEPEKYLANPAQLEKVEEFCKKLGIKKEQMIEVGELIWQMPMDQVPDIIRRFVNGSH